MTQPLTTDDLAALDRCVADGTPLPWPMPDAIGRLVAELRASQEREAAAYRRGRESMRAGAVAACVAVGAALRDGAEADGTDDEGRAQQAAAEDCARKVRALPVDG